MTINLSLPHKESEIKPRITVIGVGGAGGNAVNNMISAALEGVEFIVANTDAQALGQSLADRRVQLGITITQGLGAGAAEGQDRSRVAAESAISNPLLEDHSMKGAKGVLINITGGLDMTLHEVDEAANRIREEVDADANIIFGSTFDATMQGRMRVSVVATGIAALAAQQPAPNYLSLDMNRPMQTGQPALSRPAAPPVGRVAMPAAAMAPPPAPMAAAPVAAPVAPVAPPPMMAP